MFDYDVAYLGSGHSCWHGAVTLAAAGKKVVLMDHDLPGGTCTNYGCDAKILLDGPFEFVEGLQRYQDVCVNDVGTIDWKKLMSYKKKHLAPFAEFIPGMLKQTGIDFIRERGKLLDAHTIQAGDRTITAETIVLGVGQRNARLNIPGQEYLHGSREFLDIEGMPEHLVCIGAGIISMEFASMALTLGNWLTGTTPLTARIQDAAMRGVASMSAGQVEPIIHNLLDVIKRIQDEHAGQTCPFDRQLFFAVYDLQSLEPKPEYKAAVKNAVAMMREADVPLDGLTLD